jgi:hypothetical protein
MRRSTTAFPTPRPLQRRRIEQLTALGFRVYVLDSKEQIGEIMDEVQAL